MIRPSSQAAAIRDATTWEDLCEIIRVMWERLARIDDELAGRRIEREDMDEAP